MPAGTAGGRAASIRPDAARLHPRDRDRRDPDDRAPARRAPRSRSGPDVPAGDPGADAERGRRSGVDEVRPQGADVQRRVGLLERSPRDRVRAQDDPVRRRRRGRRRRRRGHADAVRVRQLQLDAGAVADRDLAAVRRAPRRVRDGRGRRRARARGGRGRRGPGRQGARRGDRLRLDLRRLPPDRAGAKRRGRDARDRAGAVRRRDRPGRRRLHQRPRDVDAAQRRRRDRRAQARARRGAGPQDPDLLDQVRDRASPRRGGRRRGGRHREDAGHARDPADHRLRGAGPGLRSRLRARRGPAAGAVQRPPARRDLELVRVRRPQRHAGVQGSQS